MGHAFESDQVRISPKWGANYRCTTNEVGFGCSL